MTAFTPSLRQLRYLVELDAQRHFGRAATALGVGQSTLSAGIAELERLVGVTLVERSSRAVRFTDVGEQFLVRARAVVEASLALTDFASASAEPLSGALRLGIIPTVAPFLLPRILEPLANRFPALTLRIREQPSEAACAALQRGTLDCLILALPFDCGRVETAELMRDALLLARSAEAGEDELDRKQLLLLEDGHCLNDHGLTACGLPRAHEAAMVATSLHTLVGLVEAGFGATFVPQLALDAGLVEGRNLRMQSLGERAERRIVLAWRKEAARAADFRLLADAIRAVLHDQ